MDLEGFRSKTIRVMVGSDAGNEESKRESGQKDRGFWLEKESQTMFQGKLERSRLEKPEETRSGSIVMGSKWWSHFEADI